MKFGRNNICWCGSGQKYKNCHMEIDEKIKLYRMKGYEVPNRTQLKTIEDIHGVRESGLRNIELLDYISEFVVDGITTEELDQRIYQKTIELGGIPATLGYEGYPKSVCISINEVVCHGIPSEQIRLKNGDIVNIDVTTIYNRYYSDSSRMFCVGKVSNERKRLVEIAKECLDLGIEQVRPWGFLGDIGQVIKDHAHAYGYSVVRDIGGHGVGLSIHEEPWVSHVASAGTGMLLVPGLIFTIEPMINMGSANVHTNRRDGWTVTTDDGQPSAQWEKTVLVTKTGVEILAY
ncbi:methionyl aminopeptidase [Propionispora vibrioides]|jgi:methionyl aminopeptidase|uniref:Methionine aminopeptidase n=1 Tax=Propionispora vibrioides TaxID=112903 RepID=A0A1H8VGS1_9FIRM|nr:methionyl aminopeptidase [Propionispora vibrioides]SEP14417.1 methionine aminopeptidase, type I [Propionispora vibrioides]